MLDVKTQASPARQKSKKKVMTVLAIIAAVSIVLIVFGGFVLGPILKNAVGAAGMVRPADGGLADAVLKQDVWNSITAYESGLGCVDPEPVLVSVSQQPDAAGVWVERWDVNACGVSHSFNVRFSPSPGGGVVYAITR